MSDTIYVYTVAAEWDVGLNDNIYATYEAAERDLNEALLECVEMPFGEAEAEGLASIEMKEVIE